MNLLQNILQGQGGAIINQVAGQFGLDKSQAESAISALIPALAKGIQNNASSANGLQALMGALQSGNHQQYVEQPEILASEETKTDGNAILGHIFGSKEVSREVASRAAAQSGVDSSILKTMLPVLASAVMGSLSKQASSAQMGGGNLVQGLMSNLLGGGNESGGMMQMLSGFLDADKDGSYLDDVMGMFAKAS